MKIPIPCCKKSTEMVLTREMKEEIEYVVNEMVNK